MEEKKEKVSVEEDKILVLLEDLSSLESYARDLFSFLPLPVCLISSIGIILDTNPSFEEISGYGTEEIIGSPVENVFDEKEIEALTKETLEKGVVKNKEIKILTKEKTEIIGSAATTLRKTEEGEVVGYFLGFFDLSKVKKRERELKETQAALTNMIEDAEEARVNAEEEKNKTEAIINNLTDGLLVFNKENKLLLMNPLAEKIFDVKTRDLVNRSVSELKTFPTLDPLIKILEKEAKKVFKEELLVKENLVFEVTTAHVEVKEKKLGSLVILHDISREKVVERMKTEFVSLAAHQLRTPLSAIKWTLKMLLDGDLGEVTEEQKSFVTKTYKSNERMISLINDLLDITRIEEGRYVYKPVLAELEPVIRLVINSSKDEAERKKIKLEFKKSEKKLPRVVMDVEKIKLVAQNFIDNAIKYTPAGGGVRVSLKCLKKEIEFSVKDTGVGIPKDQQERVFIKFFRGANVVRMDTEGTGLGLFISKNIIEAHGGRAWFESEENKGSVFYFTLPIKEEFEEFLKEF